MKSAIFASLIATAAAFAPVQQGKVSTELKVSELGRYSFCEPSNSQYHFAIRSFPNLIKLLQTEKIFINYFSYRYLSFEIPIAHL